MNLTPSKFVKDLTGLTFGKLTVIRYAGTNRSRNALWICRCTECGKETVVSNAALRRQTTCGCKKKKSVGKFMSGELYVVSQDRDANGKRLYTVLCACGKCFTLTKNEYDRYNLPDCGCGTQRDFFGNNMKKARKVYIAYHHVNPSKNEIVVFMDGDINNLRINNLRLITKKASDKARGMIKNCVQELSCNTDVRHVLMDCAELICKANEKSTYAS